MVEIAIDLDDVDVVLIRWSATDPYLVVRPDGSTSREDSRPGIPVWDADAASDIDEVIDTAYTTGYFRGLAAARDQPVAVSQGWTHHEGVYPWPKTVRRGGGLDCMDGGSANVG